MGERVEKDAAKNPKGVVSYGVMSDPMRRCGVCVNFEAEYHGCMVVAGEVLADMTCDLFSVRRATRPLSYGGPSSLLAYPLDVPTVRRSAQDEAQVVKGYIAEADDGTLLVRDTQDGVFWNGALAKSLHSIMGNGANGTMVRFDSATPAPHRFDLHVPTEGGMALVESAGLRQAIAKADEERRYTLGPLYLPDTLDAHNEFVTKDDLQSAAWGYVRSSIEQASNTIFKQHTDEPIGEWVEMVTWPYEHTTKVTIPGEGEVERTFPPGTVYQGIVWHEDAWPDVKDGKIRGLSLGGYATKVADKPS